MRRSSIEIFSISVLFLQFINRRSSGTESGSPKVYDSRRVVCFDVVFIEDSGSWGPVFCGLGSISVDGCAIMIVSFDNNIVVGFKFDFIGFRFRSGLSRFNQILVLVVSVEVRFSSD
jgi:hypothetical protein